MCVNGVHVCVVCLRVVCVCVLLLCIVCVHVWKDLHCIREITVSLNRFAAVICGSSIARCRDGPNVSKVS